MINVYGRPLPLALATAVENEQVEGAVLLQLRPVAGEIRTCGRSS